jgi:hypothetical protein
MTRRGGILGATTALRIALVMPPCTTVPPHPGQTKDGSRRSGSCLGARFEPKL